jgi:hypothetical protein
LDVEGAAMGRISTEKCNPLLTHFRGLSGANEVGRRAMDLILGFKLRTTASQ